MNVSLPEMTQVTEIIEKEIAHQWEIIYWNKAKEMEKTNIVILFKIKIGNSLLWVTLKVGMVYITKKKFTNKELDVRDAYDE